MSIAGKITDAQFREVVVGIWRLGLMERDLRAVDMVREIKRRLLAVLQANAETAASNPVPAGSAGVRKACGSAVKRPAGGSAREHEMAGPAANRPAGGSAREHATVGRTGKRAAGGPARTRLSDDSAGTRTTNDPAEAQPAVDPAGERTPDEPVGPGAAGMMTDARKVRIPVEARASLGPQPTAAKPPAPRHAGGTEERSR